MARGFRPLRSFPDLGERPKRRGQSIPFAGSRALGLTRTLNYNRIKRQVMQVVASLPADKQAAIPSAGTLPEIMVAYGLVQLGYVFQSQNAQSGGRLRLGGSVVDFIVYFGSAQVVIRVHGDYWHSLPERVQKDAVQLLRLRARRYRVFDVWEHDVYRAWVENRLLELVDDGIQAAA